MCGCMRIYKRDGRKEGIVRETKKGGMMKAASEGVRASTEGSRDKDERVNEIKENRKAVANF